MSILKAATRVNETLRNAGKPDLPLLPQAKDDAHFLYEYAIKQGFDLNSQFQPSHSAQRLIELIDVSTAPDTPFEVAITAIWAYMMSSWAGWALFKERANSEGTPLFQPICEYLARPDALIALTLTQVRLNSLLADEAEKLHADKAAKTFEEIVRRACAVLDNTLYLGKANRVPLCTCGRQGHTEEQCTFKSHI